MPEVLRSATLSIQHQVELPMGHQSWLLDGIKKGKPFAK